MTLLYPVWLLLLIPLLVSWFTWKLPSKMLQIMRLTTYLLLTLAMCIPMIEFSGVGGTLVVVADRSYSMPQFAKGKATKNAQEEIIQLLESKKKSDDRLAVVSFGSRAYLERRPLDEKFSGFVHEIDANESNLSGAIEYALSLIPKNTKGKILLLTDGRWTGKDPEQLAPRAASREISIDYRLMQRKSAGDTAISRIQAPEKVSRGEAFMITIWVYSPGAQEITYRLTRGKNKVAQGKKNVFSGLNRLTFRDKAKNAGAYNYILDVTGASDDPVIENNRARILVDIHGAKPVLCVSPAKGSGLAMLLEKGGIEVEAITPEQCSWDLDELAGYCAVVLENVPAESLGVKAMANLSAWVKESGRGLIMTGGHNSYAPGGYFRSPLEKIMPLSMELRREHRKLSLSIVVAMDRSGSMGMSVPGGKTKMDLANISAVQVLDLLTSMDEFGVIAVDSESHIVVPLCTVEKARGKRGKVLSIMAGGGGIYVFEALATASKMLLSSKSETRHIILFADAADAEEPGKYKELLEKCSQANITVSVVGLGTPSDCDAQLLKDVAKLGKGRCFFTDKPKDLPRIFAQDTFVVARSSFVEETTGVKITPELLSLTGKRFPAPPHIGGYNLCYLRQGVYPAALSRDQYKAPIVAAWHVGLGRVVCYTGEADGKYTGSIKNWNRVGEFFTSLVRWSAGTIGKLPSDMAITQETRRGSCIIKLHLDPKREVPPFAKMPEINVLRGFPNATPVAEKAEMQWVSPDTLQVEIPLHGKETVIPTMELENVGKLTLAPTALAYSPEFKPANSEAVQTIKRIARATGGKERLSPVDIWKEMPHQPKFYEIGRYLSLAAILLLLLEILERRSGLLSSLRLPAIGKTAKEPRRVPRSEKRTLQKRSLSTGKPELEKKEEHTEQNDREAQESPGLMDALRRASRKSVQRTERKK